MKTIHEKSVLYRTLHPEVFQGGRKTGGYFEGWYFKHVSKTSGDVVAVIPGVSLDRAGKSHAFIQLIDGKTGSSEYAGFDADEFEASERELLIRIGKNTFSRDRMELDFTVFGRRILGSVRYADSVPLPGTILSPGIMGWYSWVPFMECYHGIVSLHHAVSGTITAGNTLYEFDGGDGYCEKDWGRSFPSSWIWLQTNSFPTPGTSFSFSIARIPWLGRSFPGFLCVLLHEGKIYRFATWTGASVRRLTTAGDLVSIVLGDGRHSLSVRVGRKQAGELRAPVSGKMDRRIAESIDAVIDLELTDAAGHTVFAGRGGYGGAEVMGDIGELVPPNAG